MCIAIVKPAGISISEEALFNGWRNNNDGAGFCCIDDNDNFIIHKSMTWEGFIHTYRDAEAKYGETSTFLIHFRITSKGATNLENCHPFQIDDNKVMIHNGTITAIPIDKKDTRSDTKIFAEEYLANLPNDWEDNAVIWELIEDYIGYSKICMLDKYKGFFIFNENMGSWDDNIWYSNNSYKKYVPTVYLTSDATKLSNGFYSFKKNRWVFPAEASLMTAEEIKLESLDNKIYDKCGVCYDYSRVDDMYEYMGKYYCVDCLDELDHLEINNTKVCQGCNKHYDEKQINTYHSYSDGIDINLCDDCADWGMSMDLGLVKLEDSIKGV